MANEPLLLVGQPVFEHLRRGSGRAAILGRGGVRREGMGGIEKMVGMKKNER